MSISKSSVAYMTEYLKHALEFEKHVYIWSCALDTANKNMKQLQSDNSYLENACVSHSIGCPEYINNNSISSNNSVKYNNYSVICFIIFAVISILCCFIGFPQLLFVTIPLGLFIVLILKNKSNRTEEYERNIESERRQRILHNHQLENTSNELIYNRTSIEQLHRKQQEIFESLSNAKSVLVKIYSENVLPVKYRSLEAVATMYEYLSTGRCNCITGHGGIYDTYETERVQIEQLRQLTQINARLQRIEDYQRCIYKELKTANQTLLSINSSLLSIEKSNIEIARNTAISAEANRQTADAARWLAWDRWTKS